MISLILKTSQTMLARSANVVSHHFRNGQELKWLRSCSVTNVCYRPTDKEVTEKKEPKVDTKRDYFCTDFHLLIPHTCIENQSEADKYLVKCTLISHKCIGNQSEADKYLVETDDMKTQRNTEKSAKRKKLELIEDGYLEVLPKKMVTFDHPLTALLDGVKVAIYKERKDEYADRLNLDERRLIIRPNRRMIIDGHAEHVNLLHKIFRQLLPF